MLKILLLLGTGLNDHDAKFWGYGFDMIDMLQTDIYPKIQMSKHLPRRQEKNVYFTNMADSVLESYFTPESMAYN